MRRVCGILMMIVVVGSFVGHAQAVEPRIGVGYQGMYVGNFLQGVSGCA